MQVHIRMRPELGQVNEPIDPLVHKRGVVCIQRQSSHHPHPVWRLTREEMENRCLS